MIGVGEDIGRARSRQKHQRRQQNRERLEAGDLTAVDPMLYLRDQARRLSQKTDYLVVQMTEDGDYHATASDGQVLLQICALPVAR